MPNLNTLIGAVVVVVVVVVTILHSVKAKKFGKLQSLGPKAN